MTQVAGGSSFLTPLDQEIADSLEDFNDAALEWRRLFSELLGTFFLVLVAAGGGMMGQAFPNTISRTAAVVAPGLMVMAIIMFMGKVSGAHLNPAVSIAFSLRGDFPWRRVPGYIVVQLVGATLACLFLRWVIDVSATYGSNYPASGFSAADAFLMEAVLTIRARQRHPRHRIGCAEHRHVRRVRRRRLHRPRGPVGQPDLGRLDESGAHVRPRSRRHRLHELLGLRRRADRSARHWLSAPLRFFGARAAAVLVRLQRKALSRRRSSIPRRHEASAFVHARDLGPVQLHRRRALDRRAGAGRSREPRRKGPGRRRERARLLRRPAACRWRRDKGLARRADSACRFPTLLVTIVARIAGDLG